MITTSAPTTPGRPTCGVHRIAPPTTGSVLAGLAVAFVVQIGAAVVAAVSLVIVIAAAFANFGNYSDDQESTWWVIFAVPFAILAAVTYVVSGFAAARTMRTNLGWLTLLIPPTLIVLRIAIAV